MRLNPGGTSGNPPSIGRRRGASAAARGKAMNLVLNQKSLLVLAALCATIFATGLILGTHIFGAPGDIHNGGGTSVHKDADVSPHVAASAKVAASDIQNLILESAKAEKIEERERELEREALRRGDKAGALHLRGALAPGDPNYNPHHHVDDVLDDDESGFGSGGDEGGVGGVDAGDEGEDGDMPADGGDGRANASNIKTALAVMADSVPHDGAETGKEDMHNHFADALKEELKHQKEKIAEKLKESVNEMHQNFAEVVESERWAVDALKSGVDRLKDTAVSATDRISRVRLRGGAESDGGDKVSLVDTGDDLPHYPYMVAPVPEEYNFAEYQPLGGGRFVEYNDGESPYAIDKSLMSQSDELARSRKLHVLNAMKHAWKGYKTHAFGHDEIHPASNRATDNWGGMGTTLVDSLDTLWIMGLKDEFWEGRDWVRDHLSSNVGKDVSVFETTIRSLGGLLSAYDFSHDEAFLTKADDLGSRLIKAYDNPSNLPFGSISLANGVAHNFGWTGNSFLLAEIGTNQIENRYLSHATGKKEYAMKSERVFDILHTIMPPNGLMPLYLKGVIPGDSAPAHFSNDKLSFGAMGDSAYEYMLKIWMQGGRKETKYREMWDRSVQGMHEVLLQKSSPNGLTYIADKEHGKLNHKMDHLACFMGGALALGAYTDPGGLDTPRAQRDLKTAKALTYTCYQMYARTKTGISPEFVDFRGANDFTVPSSASYYILRPETVEAFYYLSALTGDPIYREWGWEVFQSIEKYCKLPGGYGSFKNVEQPGMKPEDRMESFFLAETLKYLYLLFDPDSEIDILNKHVFNTEAHPLKIFSV